MIAAYYAVYTWKEINSVLFAYFLTQYLFISFANKLKLLRI